MGQEQVTAEFTNVLKIAISAFDSETESFEDALQQNRKMQPPFFPFSKT